MKGKKINFQTLFNIFIVITIGVLLYFHFRKKESFEGIAGSSFVSRVPKGTVVAYYPVGGDLSIPAGWAFCDGTKGTPDLRGKFILGYNSTENQDTSRIPNNLGGVGGTEVETLTEEQMPLHTHGVERTCLGGGVIGWDTDDRLVSAGARDDCRTNNGKRKITEGTGKGQPHNNLPPFYVLVYIMKL